MRKRALYEKRIGGALGALAGAGAGYAAAEPEHKWEGMFAGGVLGGALGTGAGHVISRFRSPATAPSTEAATKATRQAARPTTDVKTEAKPPKLPKVLDQAGVEKWKKKLPELEGQVRYLASPKGGNHKTLLDTYEAYQKALKNGSLDEIRRAHHNFILANWAVNAAIKKAKTSALLYEVEKRAWKAQSLGALGGAGDSAMQLLMMIIGLDVPSAVR